MDARARGCRPTPERRRQAAALRSRGLSVTEIGRLLGVSPETVRRMLAARDPATRLADIRCSACRAVVVTWLGSGPGAGPVLCRP